MQWFDVDKGGLAKILKERGFAFAIYELIQNALDTDSPTVEVYISWEGGICQVQVIDEHPEGFSDFTHAWTLFAESEKKGNPAKRGRFNLGEKLVLAVCKTARIETTKGTVIFDAKGRRKGGRKRESGSRFWGWVPMLKREADEMLEAAQSVIVPIGKTMTVNGTEVQRPTLKANIKVKALDTVIADEDGNLKRTKRGTTIAVFDIAEDEIPYIHEMGIPVCPLEEGDPWHIDVQQKVPLTMDRSSLPGAFLHKVRLAVVNELHDDLDEEQANAGWVRTTTEDANIDEEAMTKVLDLRFGRKRVEWDPHDQEANALATSKGYKLVYPSQMSKAERGNARRVGLKMSSVVTPSPKVLSSANGVSDEFPEDLWTPEMHAVVEMATVLANKLVDAPVVVRIAERPREGARAWYGKGGMLGTSSHLSFNLSRLGKPWFRKLIEDIDGATYLGVRHREFLALLIHELGHQYSGNHLDGAYHGALCKLGARLALVIVEEPELLKVTVKA